MNPTERLKMVKEVLDEWREKLEGPIHVTDRADVIKRVALELAAATYHINEAIKDIEVTP